MRHGDWIQTYTGRQFWPLDPRPEDVEILDIAHALSNLCRFTGHTKRFYSVAQHSVLLAAQVPPADALWGLLHDASEAYLIDVARPVKRMPEMAAYRDAEARVMRAICERFALPFEQPESVTVADQRMLATEKRDLMGPAPAPWASPADPYPFTIAALNPTAAELQFLEAFVRLGCDLAPGIQAVS